MVSSQLTTTECFFSEMNPQCLPSWEVVMGKKGCHGQNSAGRRPPHSRCSPDISSFRQPLSINPRGDGKLPADHQFCDTADPQPVWHWLPLPGPQMSLTFSRLSSLRPRTLMHPATSARLATEPLLSGIASSVAHFHGMMQFLCD